MLGNKKPILFAIALLCGLGGLFAVDRWLAGTTSLASIAAIDARIGALVSEMDRRLNQVRDTLGHFDAAHAVTCSAMDNQSRAESLLAIPQVKLITVIGLDATQTCATLPIRWAAASDFGKEGGDLSPIEHFDVVTLGQEGRLGLRLQRKPANSATMLAAIIPLTDIAVWLSQVVDDVDRGDRVRLSIGGRMLVELNGDFAPEPVKPAIISHSAEIGSSEMLPGDDAWVTTKSATYPIAISLSRSSMADKALDLPRLIVDVSGVAALVGLLALFFIRRSPPEFGDSRFDLAFKRGEFDVTYRPILDLQTGKLSGAAVEIRWRRHGGIVLPSSEFMPALIRSGFESQMLRYALAKCQTELSAAYKVRPRLQLKIALDHSTLLRPGFLDQVRRGLASSNLASNQLVLALTGLPDSDKAKTARAVMLELQKIGIQLELRQSFGEVTFDGANMTASSIGLDIRLVQALNSSAEASVEHARAWIGSVVKQCSATGIRVCAYQIPSYEALKQLKALGIDEAEGAVFTPALPSGLFMALVAKAGLEQADADQVDPRQRKAAGLSSVVAP